MKESIAIKDKIFTIRGVQVMVDRDLAELYGVETRRINEQVSRNLERFPARFMFRMSKAEFEIWKSQIATSKYGTETIRMGLRKLPYVFTEQGVAMLATVLKSEKAVQTSIDIMDAFIAMRKFFQLNNDFLIQLEQIRRMQVEDRVESAAKFETIFDALERGNLLTSGLLLPNSEYEALRFATRLIQSAKEEIVIIDPYSDVSTLDVLSRKATQVKVCLVCKDRGSPTATEIAKFNKQYGGLNVVYSDKFHDRFVIIDGRELHNLGSSINSLGRRLTAYSTRDSNEIAKLLSLI